MRRNSTSREVPEMNAKKGRLARIIAIALALSTAVAGLAACTGRPGTAPLDSLFVASFNTQLLSPAMCFLAESTPTDPTDNCHTEQRANDIADHILSKS